MPCAGNAGLGPSLFSSRRRRLKWRIGRQMPLIGRVVVVLAVAIVHAMYFGAVVIVVAVANVVVDVIVIVVVVEQLLS